MTTTEQPTLIGLAERIARLEQLFERFLNHTHPQPVVPLMPQLRVRNGLSLELLDAEIADLEDQMKRINQELGWVPYRQLVGAVNNLDGRVTALERRRR
jgi:hypothetical protein